jgi:hypothetical protein
MYAGVPTNAVREIVRSQSPSLHGRVGAASASASALRASPKSVTQTRPLSPTSTLSGLKSR